MWIPTGSKVIVKPEENHSNSVLEIIQYHDNQPNKGTVVTCGPDVGEVMDSDTVVYGKYAYEELLLDDNVYHILRESDILCKLTEE